jgi:hypothetical protein
VGAQHAAFTGRIVEKAPLSTTKPAPAAAAAERPMSRFKAMRLQREQELMQQQEEEEGQQGGS